jgi:hypothetical protein
MASGVHSRRALRLRFGREGATPSACSALVVSHHLGGFLLRSFRGLVSSRGRSWGSSRFRRASTRLTEARKPLPDSLAAFPATSVRTPRRMILACSRTTSPWPLPPWCSACRSRDTLHLRGLAPQPSLDFSAPLRALEEVLSFLGLVPLQGPSRPPRTRAGDPRTRSDAASCTSTSSWLRSVPHAHAEARCEVPGRAMPSEDGHHGDPSRPESLLEFAAMEGRSLSPWRSRSLSGAEVRACRSRHRPSWGS